ncbi:hypothetical protein Tco_0714111 [Tanacetum coccineum]
MASESSLQQQPKQLTHALNVNFECEDGIVSFNNGIALLEFKEPLYHPMLQFLSNSCISTALVKQPLAYYSKYLREFWYTAKETVRVGLATLRLVDQKDTSISSTDLVNSSLLRTRYFSPTWRVLMVYIVKCLGEHLLGNIYKNDKLNTFKPHQISASFKQPSASEVPLTSHMLKHAKEPVATADATKGIESSESAEKVRNQTKPANAKKVQETIVEEVVKDSRIT